LAARGNFFAVDRRAWAAVCGIGSMNAAVAYLVLARGTLKDMRTTAWSVNAIETHTGIARPRAAAAIRALLEASLAEQIKAGSRPSYRLTFGTVSDWIWLPNSVIDGASGETPPVERIRQAQSLPVLRLYVDLYHAQGLAADGGVNWRQLREGYHRHKIGESGPYVIWGFSPGQEGTWEQAPFVRPFLTGRKEVVKLADGSTRRDDTGLPDFWVALGVLKKTGLLEFVAHLVEADTGEASVIHPLAQGNGETIERRLLWAAHDAGTSLLTAAQAEWASAQDMIVVPVLAHIEKVAVLGLPRLRHRAATSATAEWAERAEEWDAWIERYQEIAEKAWRDNGMQHQR
jgi:hypothetical protein